MKELGIISRVAKRKPWNTLRVANYRLVFCEKYFLAPDHIVNWIICDESRINLWHDDMTRIYVKRRVKESHLPGYTKRILKFRGGGVGVDFFAAVGWNGFAPLMFYEERFTSRNYTAFLSENWPQVIIFIGGDHSLLIQDPASWHNSLEAHTYYRESNISKIVVPGNCPDINIIEHVFLKLKKESFLIL